MDNNDRIREFPVTENWIYLDHAAVAPLPSIVANAMREIIVDVEPPNALSAHSLSQVLFNLDRFEEAWSWVETCRELAPEYPACALLEANILKKIGREMEAQIAYTQALELRARVEEQLSESSER